MACKLSCGQGLAEGLIDLEKVIATKDVVVVDKMYYEPNHKLEKEKKGHMIQHVLKDHHLLMCLEVRCNLI